MKQILQTNFVDDILSDSMGGKRRFNLIPNNDGTYSLEDVTEYDQLGSQFGSANINATNNAVNESADKNKILETLAEINATTEKGYMADALAVKELTNSLNVKAYSNNNVLTIEYEGMTLGYAYGYIYGGMCTILGSLKVPRNVVYNTTIAVGTLNNLFKPFANIFVPCVSWGGRRIGNVAVSPDGRFLFASSNAEEGVTGEIDMYFQITYATKPLI